MSSKTTISSKTAKTTNKAKSPASTAKQPAERNDPIKGMMEERRAEAPRAYSDFEVQELMRELDELRRMVAAQRQKVDTLEDVAAADPITGLANPRALEDELAKSLSTAKRYGRQHALLVLEVDDFAGYQALDNELSHDILKLVAGLVRQNIRPTDIAARLEDGTFAVILNELRVVENATMRARELARMVSVTPCIGRTRTVQLRASVAAVGFGADDDVFDVLQRAMSAERSGIGH